MLDEALIQGVVIAHRGGLAGERVALNVLAKTRRFAAWLEGYKPEHGPRPNAARAVWMFAAVALAEAAMRRKHLAYSKPSPAGLAGVWQVLTGSSECPRRLYRRYQNLQVHISIFEQSLRGDR